jgi:DNA-binding FadR family transcriptional regulator
MNQGAPLHQRTLDGWGMGIVGGAYPPGSRIAIDDAAQGETVSRTVAREAMRVLESMGLVTVRRKSGAVVNPKAQWNLFDPRVIAWRLRGAGAVDQLHALSQLRAAVEPVAARLAASHSRPEHWEALTKHALGMAANARQADGEAYLANDAAFHQVLLEASGNDMFAALGGVVREVLAGRTHGGYMPATANTLAISLHIEAAAAIQAGDAPGAEAAIRSIVAEADQAVTAMGQPWPEEV